MTDERPDSNTFNLTAKANAEQDARMDTPTLVVEAPTAPQEPTNNLLEFPTKKVAQIQKYNGPIVGDWIRFYQGEELRIGKVEYMKPHPQLGVIFSTDRGQVALEQVVEHRSKAPAAQPLKRV